MHGIAQLVFLPPHPFPLSAAAATEEDVTVGWKSYFDRTMDLSAIGWFQGRFMPLGTHRGKSYGMMGVAVYAPDDYEVHTCCLHAQIEDFPIFYRTTVVDLESRRHVELPHVERISTVSNRVPERAHDHDHEYGYASGGLGDAVQLVSTSHGHHHPKEPWISFETTTFMSGRTAVDYIQKHFSTLVARLPQHTLEQAIVCVGSMRLLHADEPLNEAFTMQSLDTTLPDTEKPVAEAALGR